MTRERLLMNELTARQRERIIERLRRGDSLRKIQCETGHRRETIARVGRRAGVIPSDRPAKDAADVRRTAQSRCEPFRAFIESELGRGASARTIHRGLVESFGYDGAYSSVKRFIRTLRADADTGRAGVVSLAAFPSHHAIAGRPLTVLRYAA